MRTDPLAGKYYSVTPYAYCLNNPVRYTDPIGMSAYPHSSTFVDPNGTIVDVRDDNDKAIRDIELKYSIMFDDIINK